MSLIAAGFLAFGILQTVRTIVVVIASAESSLDYWIGTTVGFAIVSIFLGLYYAYAWWIWRGEPVARAACVALGWMAALFSVVFAVSVVREVRTADDPASGSRILVAVPALVVTGLLLCMLVYMHRPEVKAWFSTLEGARRRIRAKRANA